jgi:uncharacterized membrane protein
LGLVLGLSVLKISIIVILSEFVLMAIVDYAFAWSLDRFQWSQAIKNRSERVQLHLKQGKWTARLIRLGWLGPLTITALPFAGGVWTGMALARVMLLSHRKTILAVGAGAVLGCSIFALASLGVLNIVEIPSN